jgi:hypothetical protein
VRVVLDSNVVISALISTGTAPDHLYHAWLRGEIAVVTSAYQIAEIGEVLRRPRMRKHVAHDEAELIVENLASRAVVLDKVPVTPISPDPKDDPILAIAIAGEAQLIVSGDKRDMRSLGRVRGIPICSPSEAVAWLHEPR